MDKTWGKVRIALRCEKTMRNYASFLALVCGFILIKSVHTVWECTKLRITESIKSVLSGAAPVPTKLK
jgi:hypothetical protein